LTIPPPSVADNSTNPSRATIAITEVFEDQSSFPTEEPPAAALLVTQDIARKWTGPIFTAADLNQPPFVRGSHIVLMTWSHLHHLLTSDIDFLPNFWPLPFLFQLPPPEKPLVMDMRVKQF